MSLYNGIWIGPQRHHLPHHGYVQPRSCRDPERAVVDHVGTRRDRRLGQLRERQPTSGPIKNEFDTSFDSLGTYRTHYGSGGSTTIAGLDYRFDIGQSRINSFIDGDYTNLNNFPAQFNYRVNDSFKVFGAIEYKRIRVTLIGARR